MIIFAPLFFEPVLVISATAAAFAAKSVVGWILDRATGPSPDVTVQLPSGEKITINASSPESAEQDLKRIISEVDRPPDVAGSTR